MALNSSREEHQGNRARTSGKTLSLEVRRSSRLWRDTETISRVCATQGSSFTSSLFSLHGF